MTIGARRSEHPSSHPGNTIIYGISHCVSVLDKEVLPMLVISPKNDFIITYLGSYLHRRLEILYFVDSFKLKAILNLIII